MVSTALLTEGGMKLCIVIIVEVTALPTVSMVLVAALLHFIGITSCNTLFHFFGAIFTTPFTMTSRREETRIVAVLGMDNESVVETRRNSKIHGKLVVTRNVFVKIMVLRW
jgi:hypothetical protein